MQLAAYQLGGRAVHIGTNFNHSPVVDYCENIADDDLRGVYNACQWWAALRRKLARAPGATVAGDAAAALGDAVQAPPEVERT